jgi:hypothetical protein
MAASTRWCSTCTLIKAGAAKTTRACQPGAPVISWVKLSAVPAGVAAGGFSVR